MSNLPAGIQINAPISAEFATILTPDALALVAKLHQAPGLEDTPLLVLSASPELDVAELATKAGARAYLNKPIRLQTLLDTIQTYTGG